MPLPFSLGHINLWLLEDGDGWTVVDTGVNIDECRQTWEHTFADRMQGRPVSRVVVTHLHPDHVGCAGWLVQHFDACIMCGQCERYCPTGAGIRMSTDWDTAGFGPEDFEERVEKELFLCEVCGDVLAPADQIAWLTGRLGPIAFANPKTCLGPEFHTDAVDDVLLSHHISCVSLATVARHAQPAMPDGGALTVGAFQEGTNLLVAVSDTGVGIDPDDVYIDMKVQGKVEKIDEKTTLPQFYPASAANE